MYCATMSVANVAELESTDQLCTFWLNRLSGIRAAGGTRLLPAAVAAVVGSVVVVVAPPSWS